MNAVVKMSIRLFSLFLFMISYGTAVGMTVQNLKCEYLSNPVAVDNPSPRLSWQLQSEQRGKFQTAYRILVADSPSLLKRDTANVWDSGRIPSSRSTQIKYNGRALASREQLYWKVMVWDEHGKPCPWSEIASWEMGFLKPSDWTAQWIALEEDRYPDSTITSPAPYFRKTFSAVKKIQKARVYSCGLGFYELYLNGQKIGDQVLAPAVTNYDRRPLQNLIYHYDDQSKQRCLYNTFDLTSALMQGENTIGIILGNGWYNQRERTAEGKMWYDTPRVIAQLEIEYTDGTRQLVNTDNSWMGTTGPLVQNAIFTGEVYDARLELGDWAKNGYNDANWNLSLNVRPPSGKLQSQLAPFDKVIRTLNPNFEKKLNDSTWLYSLPETVSGWVQLKVQGRAGSRIRLRYLSEEGNDYGQSDIYILNGKGSEQWEPRFTWHAFRSFEVISTDVIIDKSNLTVRVVNTEVKRTGNFSCSNELFNKIHDAYIRTQEANFHGSVSSDCPHRERLGYTGDGQVIVQSALFTYDMTQFYKKWLNDMDDARNPKSGYVPHTAPFAGGGGGPAWGSAYVIIPWFYYCYYGDKTLLEQHYAGMKQWVEYLGSRTDENGIVVREEPNGWCLGDWCTPDQIRLPESLVNTAYYYYCTWLMSQVASTLGRDNDALSFKQSAARIKDNYHKVFFNPETHHYWEGKQGADVISLAFNLVPEKNKQQVFAAFLEQLADSEYHFDTGILATPLLLQVLTQYDQSDLAYKVLDQRTAPGFAYLLDDRNSTLWENWNGEASRCHPMFGSVVAWFYNTLAGIDIVNSEIELNHLHLKPHLIDDLSFCKCSYHSQFGWIRSEWERDKNGELRLIVGIPANTTATVHIPAASETAVTESGKKPSSEHVKFVKMDGKYAVFEVGPGNYVFSVRY